ncbi:MAG: hypothetical protein IT372_17155 [Polyangiaceae bacterium]|nr:hypothetical protein [Polyangiaceae bacterium]
MGPSFWRGAVAHLLGGDPSAEEDAALQGLIAEEICVRHAVSRLAGEHEYAFRQELLREGAYALLTEEDRALGHRLAAEWLARAGEADPLVLAGHLARGGVLPRAAELYVRGAELAAARRAYLDAERCYARAAELAGPLPVAARRARGLARFRLGRHDDALAELSAARAQAAAAGDVAAEVEILLDEAMVLDWRGDHVAAAELTAAARERGAAITAPALRARLLLGLGRMLHRADREAEAASELARAAELAAGLGDDGHETHIIALLLLGFILPWIGRLDDAARSLDEAIRRCEERSDLMHLGAALSNRALVRSYRGDREGMAADLERTIALGAQLGQPVLELVGHFNLAESLYWMDDLDAAEPHARAAAALVSRCGGSYRPAVLALEGRLHLYRGDEPRARAAAEELRALGGAPGAGALSPSEDVLCAMLELATAEADESAWDALEARSAQCSAGQEKIEVLEARALSALRRGRRAEARRRLESALSASARIPSCMSGRLRRWIAEAAACP